MWLARCLHDRWPSGRSSFHENGLQGAFELRKPHIVVDWDNVVHGYQSGWKGAAVIPDPPVPGALEFLVRALDRFTVNILSSRSHQWGGRGAMKRYLREHLLALGGCDPQGGQFEYEIPDWWSAYVHQQSAMEPWWHEVHNAANQVVREIKWPIFKPPALVTIDDRAITFTGTFPTLDEIAAFKPWNKVGRRLPERNAE
jgi:hypothetical protein